MGFHSQSGINAQFHQLIESLCEENTNEVLYSLTSVCVCFVEKKRNDEKEEKHGTRT